MKSLITILTFCFICRLAFAQDYVINLKGDTLKCTINKPLIGAPRYNVNGTIKKITPDEIPEYYVERKDEINRAVYKDGKGKLEYLLVIENGPISLYEVVYNNSNYMGTRMSSSSTTNWYVGKQSNQVFGLKTNGLLLKMSRAERKDAFAAMLKDKPALYEEYLAADKFSFDTIRQIIHRYNTGQPIPKPSKENLAKDDAYNR